ncbi:MAG: signal peptidase I [bacterium]|nr:signal peptidase I [bacterium]
MNPPPSNFLKEFVKLILLSLLIVIPFRLYIAQPFIVDGASMDPTFETGDYLIVDEVSYRFKEPERGSVLIFRYPRDPRKSFIKRVIGLPGEMVSITDGEVKIINDKYPEGLILDEPYIKFPKEDSVNYVLGLGEYFVMGDNRLSSADSRVWGPVPKDNIIGRPIIRFFPPALFPGDKSNSIETKE